MTTPYNTPSTLRVYSRRLILTLIAALLGVLLFLGIGNWSAVNAYVQTTPTWDSALQEFVTYSLNLDLILPSVMMKQTVVEMMVK